MMNRTFLRALALTVCLTTLCAVAAGCQPQTPTEPTDATTATVATVVSRPTVQLQDADDSVFLGTWNVSAEKSHISSITFNEDGTMVFVIDGNTLGGAFYMDSDTEMTMTVAADNTKATYKVDGDTITLTTDNDVWTLTKAR